MWLPLGSLPNNGNNILVSPDCLTCDKLLLIVQDAGRSLPVIAQ